MVWEFIQNEILGMRWLNELIGRLLALTGLDVEGGLGGSLRFFVFDTIKIILLLCTLIFVISYIQSYFPPERSKKIMGSFHGIWANCVSALLGTVTPFCSCSSIPLFIGFTSAGLPIGVTFSFLISSPMVDLGSLVLLMSIFGVKVAVIYVLLGLVTAVAGGALIERLHMEKYVEEFVFSVNAADAGCETLSQKMRLDSAARQMPSESASQGVPVTVKMEGHRKLFPAVANYGVRPTVINDSSPLLEVHILGDCPKGLGEGSQLEVSWLNFVRPEQKFTSLEELKQAIGNDTQRVKNFFAETHL